MENLRGGSTLPVADDITALQELTRALDAIYDAGSTNEIRKDATVFLEEAKTSPNAASQGFMLASDRSRPPHIRYFGLVLQEYNIKYRWEELEEANVDSYKQMVIQLAEKIDDNEPPYLRNKIAQVWVDLAEKAWPDIWQDLDSRLLQLWQASFAHQMMALHILEMLSEDAFSKGEQGDGAHGGSLGKACTEIFTPAKPFAELFPGRDQRLDVRSGEEGWFVRIIDRLSRCCSNFEASTQTKQFTIQILCTLRSTMPWMLLKILAVTDCIEVLGRCLQTGDLEVQIATLEVLLVLLHRTQYTGEDIISCVCPLMTRDALQLLQALFTSSKVDIDDVDDQKYLLRKKLSEAACALAGFLEQQPTLMAEHVDIGMTLDLIESILLDSSLVVSIPALYNWTRLLTSRFPPIVEVISNKYGVLLETCSKRVLRFGNLPEDSQNETFRFLLIDFDTMPERHAFTGNYRRYCSEVIEKIVRLSPFEALNHFLSQTSSLLLSLPNDQTSLDSSNYNSNSYTALRVDAQCTVVASAVKSYCNWLMERKAEGEDHNAAQSQARSEMETWCREIQSKFFSDPVVQRRVLQLVGEMVMAVFDEQSAMPLATFDCTLGKIYLGKLPPNTYGETLKEMSFACTRLLQKLVMRFPNKFFQSYPEIEAGVGKLMDVKDLDTRVKTDCRSVLFLVVHRAPETGDEKRLARMRDMMSTVLEPWQDPSFTQAATSFEAFCKLLGLEDMPNYYLSRGAQNIEDWSSQQLDEQGLGMRETVLNRTETLPLHLTRSTLTASTDKVRQGSKEHQTSVMLWDECIPVILPTLVPLLSHAHAFGNPDMWSGFPDELQAIIQRILMDRVWQSGISSETRDDFYNRVRISRTSLEGLGSAIRAAVRSVRELSYWVLHCFAQFGDALYKHLDLAEPLARAMYENAHTLSSHQVATLIQISQAIIDGCPIHRRKDFLPPLLSNLFNQVDRKLTSEWEQMDKRERSEMSDETLDQEMKAESILRQLSHAAVSLACTLLQPVQQQGTQHPTDGDPLSKVAFGNSPTLSSIIVFCSHVIRMRDTRSNVKVIALFRQLVPELGRIDSSANGHTVSFISLEVAAELREFFASEMLKSAISSFHEPYFSELQRDLAVLISHILLTCAKISNAPRDILLSLPNMSETKVDNALKAIQDQKSERERGKIVLKLLENLRGVSIHEIGKMTAPSSRSKRKTIQEQFMKIDDDPNQIKHGGSPDPGAMTELFG